MMVWLSTPLLIVAYTPVIRSKASGEQDSNLQYTQSDAPTILGSVCHFHHPLFVKSSRSIGVEPKRLDLARLWGAFQNSPGIAYITPTGCLRYRQFHWVKHTRVCQFFFKYSIGPNSINASPKYLSLAKSSGREQNGVVLLRALYIIIPLHTLL